MKTGFKDKNGREIMEGDWIRHSEYDLWEVVKDDKGIWRRKDFTFTGNLYSTLENDATTYEVVERYPLDKTK